MVEQPEENTSGFNIGDVLLAPAYGNLIHPFGGVVEKIYEHSLLVEITDNDVEDQTLVTEMNHRAVVSMADVEVIKKAPAPKPKDEEADKK